MQNYDSWNMYCRYAEEVSPDQHWWWHRLGFFVCEILLGGPLRSIWGLLYAGLLYVGSYQTLLTFYVFLRLIRGLLNLRPVPLPFTFCLFALVVKVAAFKPYVPDSRKGANIPTKMSIGIGHSYIFFFLSPFRFGYLKFLHLLTYSFSPSIISFCFQYFVLLVS